MIKEELLPYAYVEIIEILRYIPKQYVMNIPKEVLEYFRQNCRKDYRFNVTEFETFENQKMLYETKVILSVLYRDYFVDEEERKKILQTENIQMQIIEKEKSERYKVEDIFKKNEKENLINENYDDIQVQVNEKNFFNNIIDFIKSILKK